MNKKKVLKITPVLITLNLLVLFTIAGFYTYRLIKYYKLENNGSDDGVVLLVDEIKKRRSYLDETKGLVFNEEEGTYRYKGEVDDNYLFYSGMYYRIIGIDKDNNIKAISEDNVTLMYPGFENGYEKSFVNKWLNLSDAKYSGIYEDILANRDTLITKSYYCSDTIDDLENITCETKNNTNNITLLSLYDYRQAGGKTSFLNNGNSFNLGTLNKESLSYYVTEEGDVAVQPKKDKAILVRPVITISATAEKKAGNGTSNKPFRIEKYDVQTLGDAYVGSYVSINNEPYRIVKSLDNKVLVVKSNVLMKGEKKQELKFGGTNNIYNTSSGIGKYLNTTYLNTLELKANTVKGEFYTGLINLTSYDYALLRSSNVKAKVGMLTMGDLFVNEADNVLTTFRGIEADDIVYAIREGYYFGDTLTGKYNVRPAVYLKPDLKISGGVGTEKYPFTFELSNKEKTE